MSVDFSYQDSLHVRGAVIADDITQLTMQLTVPEARIGALAHAMCQNLQAGDLIALTGSLGVGKTSLARAVIQSLCAAENVPSPSFALVQSYKIVADRILPKGGLVIHADFYRLQSPDEADALAIFDENPALVIAEWPMRGNFPTAQQEFYRDKLWQITIEDAMHDVAHDVAHEMRADALRDYHISPPARPMRAPLKAAFEKGAFDESL